MGRIMTDNIECPHCQGAGSIPAYSYTHTADDHHKLEELRRKLATGEATSIRQRAGLSIRAAAHTAGISPATLGLWERQATTPTGQPGLRYAHVLTQLAAD